VQSFAAPARPSEDVKRDVAKVEARLKDIQTEMRFLINPNSKKMQYWDLVTLAALLFTLTVTPYEVALLPTKWDALLAVNQLINVIFIIDIAVNCVLPYRESIQKGAGVVRNHSKILKRYASGWLPLDVVSVLPFDLLVAADVFGGDNFNPSVLRTIRLIRLLRLLKLFRILKASRIFSRWESSISILYSTRSLIMWSVIMIVMVHMFCCGWALEAQLYGSLRTTAPPSFFELMQDRLAENPAECTGCLPGSPDHLSYCMNDCLTDCEMEALAEVRLAAEGGTADMADLYAGEVEVNEHWICRAKRQGELSVKAGHFEIYSLPLSQSGFLATANVNPGNMAEYVLNFFLFFAAQIVWSMFTGVVCGIIATGDPQTANYKNRMDELNYFFSDTDVPNATRVAVRDYMRLSRELRKKASYQELFDGLSPSLKGDVNYCLSSTLLGSVWYLRSADREVQLALAERFEHAAIAVKEKVPNTGQLYIITKGVAARAGNILTMGMSWGEDCILKAKLLRDHRIAGALTYLETASLSSEAIGEATAENEDASRMLREAALKIALQRAIVLISAAVGHRKQAKAPVRTGCAAGATADGDGPVHNGGEDAVESLSGSPSPAARGDYPSVGLDQMLAEPGGEVRELIMALNGQRGGVLAVAADGSVVNEAGEAVEGDDETGGSEDLGGLVAKLRAEAKAHSRSIDGIRAQLGEQGEMLQQIHAALVK